MGSFRRNDDTTANNRPEDVTGDGPVTLEGRTEPGGQGSPGSNQSKAEPMSPSGTHPEPLAPPHLDDMNVGGADPQAPRHPDALRTGPSATGAYADEPAGEQPTSLGGPGATPATTRPVPDPARSTGRATGPEQSLQEPGGTSHRAPGLHGTTPDGESVSSDVDGGAARMGPQALDSTAGGAGQGDAQGVPSSGSAPAAGTSEQHRSVSGIKLPEAEQA